MARKTNGMEQVTFRVPRQKVEELDRQAEEQGYANRSEYLRDLVREATEK